MPKNNKKKEKIKDTFVNPVANLGLFQQNQLSGTDYVKTRFTQDYNLMLTLYRGHWVVKKIINTIANDMTRKGIKLKMDVSPEAIHRFESAIKKKKVWTRFNQAMRWARLFGGSGALIIIDGQDNILDTPLDLDSIMLGDFKGLTVFDRWSGIQPSLEVVTDLDSIDYGLPKYYTCELEGAHSIKVHHSRILRFEGQKLPAWEDKVEMQWGASEVESILQEIIKYDNVSYNTAQLVFMANLRVLQMGDMGESLTLADTQAQSDVYNTLAAQSSLMSNFGVYLMGKDDNFDTKQYTFGGLAEVMHEFMAFLSGASEIPQTRLWGSSPTGMNATGESDEENYFELIAQLQHEKFDDNLTKLLPVIFVSEFGMNPENIDFDYNDIKEAKDDDIADLVNRKSENIIKAYEANLITQKEAREELKETGKEYNIFTNVDLTIEGDNELSNGIPEIPDFNGIIEQGENG